MTGEIVSMQELSAQITESIYEVVKEHPGESYKEISDRIPYSYDAVRRRIMDLAVRRRVVVEWDENNRSKVYPAVKE